MIRSVVLCVLCLALTAGLSISCDNISPNPRNPRAQFPEPKPEEESIPAPEPGQKTKRELIRLYFFIKKIKTEMEDEAAPMIPLKGKDRAEFVKYWPGWKKYSSNTGPVIRVRLDTYSPLGLDLEPDHPQVLLWLALRDLNKEFEMYNRFFSLYRPIDPEIPKELDIKMDACYKALKAYKDPEEL